MFKSSLAKSFLVQSRVIYALLMREIMTRYGRGGLGMLWFFLEPALLTFAFTTVWYLIKIDVVTNTPVIAFAFSGFSALQLWRNAANRATTSFRPNEGLLTHRNVKLIDVFLARIFLEWASATAAFIALGLILSVSGLISPIQDMASILMGWLLLAWFSLGLGLIVGALGARFGDFEKLWRAMNYPLFIISGVFFMVDWLPTGVREFILWVPMVHGNELIRHGFFGSMVPTYGDPAYFAMVNLAVTFIGLALAGYAQRNVVETA